MTDSALVAGLDLGTQSVKLLVYDPLARTPLALESQPLDLHAGDDGSREQQASWWTQALSACFARLDPRLRARIATLAVSGQQHGFVPLASDGRVLAPVKLWCDTSSEADGRQIMQALGGPAATIALAGNPILAGYTASKLPWTRHHRPQVYAEMAHILLPHDYLNFWLTGQRWMEYGDASGTGWLDVRRRCWSPALLRATDPQRDLSACLPPLVEADSVVALAPARADALGLPRSTLVAVGGGDNMMAAIGTGNVRPGRLTLSLGTSGTLFAYADRPVIDGDGRWAAFCDSTGGWLPLICTMNCTVATETAAQMGGLSRTQAEAAVAATAPGADGLVMLPFLNGERSPDLPAARGMLFGMEPHNCSTAQFYRAAMEGATYSLRAGLDALLETGLRFDSVLLTGGGSNSAQWRQMVADVFALPVTVPQQQEGAAFGAALQALWAGRRAAGDARTLAETVDEHLQFDATQAAMPDPGRIAAYAAGYQAFQRYLRAVTAWYRPPAS